MRSLLSALWRRMAHGSREQYHAMMRHRFSGMPKGHPAGPTIVAVASALGRQRLTGELFLRHGRQEFDMRLLTGFQARQILESFCVVREGDLVVQRAAVADNEDLVDRIARALQQVAQPLQVGLDRGQVRGATREDVSVQQHVAITGHGQGFFDLLFVGGRIMGKAIIDQLAVRVLTLHHRPDHRRWWSISSG
jgi:hypothetical protein